MTKWSVVLPKHKEEKALDDLSRLLDRGGPIVIRRLMELVDEKRRMATAAESREWYDKVYRLVESRL